jgi:hypothetical protein
MPADSASDTSSAEPTADAAAFPLLWAVAVSGHRDLPDEPQAREALRAELADLKLRAAEMDAGLVAVSSLARGADLVFAEECLAAGLRWKCLLPFVREEFFLKGGFTPEERRRAEACLDSAYPVEVLLPGIPPDDVTRDEAYQRCGHRMIEEADVILLLWDGQEAKLTGGTSEMAEYAGTLGKPRWIWNPRDGTVRRPLWPGEGEWKNRQLFHSRITDLLRDNAAHMSPAADDPCDPPTFSPRQRGLKLLFKRLDALALSHQTSTQRRMQDVLRAHLCATGAAALAVTLLAEESRRYLGELPVMAVLLALVFSVVVLAKPMLAALALYWEQRLHHLKTQEIWAQARVAAELCRSALTCWGFAGAPLTVFTDEDFPHFKRLLRTLRMAREMDRSVDELPKREVYFETYNKCRIENQEEYFQGKQRQAARERDLWQSRFEIATWSVIVVGILFGVVEALEACFSLGAAPDAHEAALCATTPTPEQCHLLFAVASFCLIVAPFYASYALAMLSIRDCRRRHERYLAMTKFLARQQHRLTQIRSTSARIAAVENTERMLMEELHEWYSVVSSMKV